MRKIFLLVFFLCFFLLNVNKNNILAKQINYGEDKIISRAQVAKMLCFAYLTKKEIFDLYQTRNINFKDVSQTKWYDKYINAVCARKLMSGVSENNFNPEQPLTVLQAQYLLEKISNIKIKVTQDNQDKNISYYLWTKLFRDAIKNLDSQITQKKIIVLATHDENQNIPENFIVTNQDYFSCDDLDFKFIDKFINIITKDKEIIAITSYDDEFELKNCKIINQSENKIYLDCGKLKRYFNYNNKNQEKIIFDQADLKIKSGEIIKIINIKK